MIALIRRSAMDDRVCTYCAEHDSESIRVSGIPPFGCTSKDGCRCVVEKLKKESE